MKSSKQPESRINNGFIGGIPALLANIEHLHDDAIGDLSISELGSLAACTQKALDHAATIMETVGRLLEVNAAADGAVSSGDVARLITALNLEIGGAVSPLANLLHVLNVERLYLAAYDEGYQTAAVEAENSQTRGKS